MVRPLSANQASAIVANCPFPVVVIDSSGAASGYNGAFEQLLTWLQQCGEHTGTPPPFGDDPLQALAEARGTVSWTELGGERRHFAISSFALPGHDNWQARIFVEISEQVRLQQALAVLDEKLTHDTLTDAATGLLNERGLILALDPQVARSRRYVRPMAVIMLGVDHTSGRHALLTDVARLLKDQLRWADLIGCTEQREFILVLPETTAEAALSLADKLAQRLAELVPYAGDDGFCFGVAGWRKSDNARILLKRAALALTGARTERKLHFAAS
jgi:diguanylate cyclase (GGDEF)-like protein